MPVSLGVQLYTLRNLFTQGADMAGVLNQVARLGYRTVEPAAALPTTPAKLARYLADCGLQSPAAHIDFNHLPNRLDALLEQAGILGHQYLVVPWIDAHLRRTADDWRRVAATLNAAGSRLRQHGVQLAYHHHHFEWIALDGELPMAILASECDAANLAFEIDVCWMTVGRQDTLAFLQQYPGRVPLLHLKQLRSLPPLQAGFAGLLDEITDVGPGVVPLAPLLAGLAHTKIRHAFVEHDQPVDPLVSIARSMAWLQQQAGIASCCSI